MKRAVSLKLIALIVIGVVGVCGLFMFLSGQTSPAAGICESSASAAAWCHGDYDNTPNGHHVWNTLDK